MAAGVFAVKSLGHAAKSLRMTWYPLQWRGPRLNAADVSVERPEVRDIKARKLRPRPSQQAGCSAPSGAPGVFPIVGVQPSGAADRAGAPNDDDDEGAFDLEADLALLMEGEFLEMEGLDENLAERSNDSDACEDSDCDDGETGAEDESSVTRRTGDPKAAPPAFPPYHIVPDPCRATVTDALRAGARASRDDIDTALAKAAEHNGPPQDSGISLIQSEDETVFVLWSRASTLTGRRLSLDAQSRVKWLMPGPPFHTFVAPKIIIGQVPHTVDFLQVSSRTNAPVVPFTLAPCSGPKLRWAICAE